MKTKYLRGSELSAPQQQQAALNRFVYRFTGDHLPSWARGTTKYPVQFKDDADWLNNTFFSVNQDGTLSRRVRECESHPTWPNNPELRYNKSHEGEAVVYAHPDGGSVSAVIRYVEPNTALHLRYAVPYNGVTGTVVAARDWDRLTLFNGAKFLAI